MAESDSETNTSTSSSASSSSSSSNTESENNPSATNQEEEEKSASQTGKEKNVLNRQNSKDEEKGTSHKDSKESEREKETKHSGPLQEKDNSKVAHVAGGGKEQTKLQILEGEKKKTSASGDKKDKNNKEKIKNKKMSSSESSSDSSSSSSSDYSSSDSSSDGEITSSDDTSADENVSKQGKGKHTKLDKNNKIKEQSQTNNPCQNSTDRILEEGELNEVDHADKAKRNRTSPPFLSNDMEKIQGTSKEQTSKQQNSASSSVRSNRSQSKSPNRKPEKFSNKNNSPQKTHRTEEKRHSSRERRNERRYRSKSRSKSRGSRRRSASSNRRIRQRSRSQSRSSKRRRSRSISSRRLRPRSSSRRNSRQPVHSGSQSISSKRSEGRQLKSRSRSVSRKRTADTKSSYSKSRRSRSRSKSNTSRKSSKHSASKSKPLSQSSHSKESSLQRREDRNCKLISKEQEERVFSKEHMVSKEHIPSKERRSSKESSKERKLSKSPSKSPTEDCQIPPNSVSSQPAETKPTASDDKHSGSHSKSASPKHIERRRSGSLKSQSHKRIEHRSSRSRSKSSSSKRIERKRSRSTSKSSSPKRSERKRSRSTSKLLSPKLMEHKGSRSRSKSVSPKRTHSRSSSKLVSPKRVELKRSKSVSPKRVERKHSRSRSKTVSPKRMDRSHSKSPTKAIERQHSRSRSRSVSPKRAHSKSPSKLASPKRTEVRRSRSRSKSVSPKNIERRRSRSQSRSNRREHDGRRSHSSDNKRTRSRRSESIERRREERKRRHAERDEREKSKRSKRVGSTEGATKPDETPTTSSTSQSAKDKEQDKENDNATVTVPKAKITERQRRTVDLLTSRTGGAYIPPAKLRLMQAQITDKASAAFQRIAWEALKKSIHGYINKVNVDNIAIITRELLKENIVRGRGLLCRSIIQAQAASPTFTHVYAALVSIINSKFPNIGELLLKRLVIQFKRAFRRNDKAVCLSSSRFIAHLVNQRVAHEILALEILTLLVESPTDDSVEVAIAFLKECGMKLTEVTSKGIGAIFEMLKNILHEGKLDKRVQYMIEVVFQVRKDGFKDHQSVIESLELVEEDDQFTHLLMLDDATNPEDILRATKPDETPTTSSTSQSAKDKEQDKENDNATVTVPKAKITERQRRTVDLLTSRTGGAYIPPAKLRLMQAQITDKASAAFQRIAWEALKKSIHGYINKVNVDNIAIITRELLKENIVRGRGLLCRSIIQAQAASPTFTHVYAALVSIINSKFPNIGELLLKRLVIQFKRAFRRNDKAVCLSSSRFIAHLVNQRVAHEILALEILTLLVESPTDDSVEVAIAFLKECGMKLTEVTSKGIGAIFEMLKNILHEGKLDKRVQYMIEVVFQVRKDGFKDHQSVIESLELVEEDDQFTHLLMLDDATNPEDILNAFKFDEQYEVNEEKYKGLSKEILGSDDSGSDADSSGSGSGSDSDDSGDSDDEDGKGDGKANAAGEIIDNTETNLIALRRTIYLTINSSLDYEECAHKLMKMQLKPGQEIELCHMFLDCCAEQRTYEKFYGLLAQRFCSINKIYIEPFEEIFRDTYQTTHRLDTNRLRNVSKFFAHLLFTDAISWDVLECIKLNEDDTTSSSRIFIKILFQELAEYMGLSNLNKKLKDEALTESLSGLFPKDNPRNTRFSINFFTSIGLGGLTDELRQFLKNAPKSVPAINAEVLANKPVVEVSSKSSSSSSSSSSSESESESDSSSTSESSSSEDDRKKKRKHKSKKKKKSSSKKNGKTKKSKTKKKNKKTRKTKKESDDSDSASNSSSTSSESSDSNEKSAGKKRKTKKSSKAKSKASKKSKKSQQKDSDSEGEKAVSSRNRQQEENGFESRQNSRKDGNNETAEKRDSRNGREFQRKEKVPQRRDSEVERRREQRERRHREQQGDDNVREGDRDKERRHKRSYSKEKRLDERNHSVVSGVRDRERDREREYDRKERERGREKRGGSDRDRNRDRRRDRKRSNSNDRRNKSHSRSRSRSQSRQRHHDNYYKEKRIRNTSKERG